MAEPLYRRRMVRSIAGAVLAVTLAGAPSPSLAQQVVVIVSGEPITALDIEQRSKLIQASTHKPPPRQEVIDELINDILEVKEAKKYGLEASDSEVENAYASMAGRMHLSTQQLTEALARAGVLPQTLKAQIRAQTVWRQLVQGRFQSSLQLGEKDILNELGSGKPGESGKPNEKEAVGYEYTLRPILLLVPRGAAAEAYEARRRDAEGLRTRFQSCEEGISLARALRDVAVRDPVSRNSADLAEQLRGVLDGTALGHLTPPEVTKDGVQVFAVCRKRETSSDTPERRAIRDKLFASRYETLAKRYLKEIRAAALIDYR
jgi:peptidyl-prolyl cis-trans isomerase SurA